MATVAQAVKAIAKATKWPETDLKHRARWLIEAGLLPKGRGGYGGAGAAEVTIKDLVTLILSMAVPVAKAAPDHIATFRNLRAEYEGKFWRLEDALVDRIEFWRDKARFEDPDEELIFLRLTFDGKYPEAEFRWTQKDGPDEFEHSLNFAREGHGHEPLRTDVADCKRGIEFGPAIFWVLWDIFTEEKTAPKKKPRRRRGRAK